MGSEKMKRDKIKDKNKEVFSISLLLADDANNVLTKYLDKDKLDFTIGSLKVVDNYLDKVRKERKNLNEKDIQKIILRCGTYLGEVIRKSRPKQFVWLSYNSALEFPSFKKFGFEKDITTYYVLFNKESKGFWFPLAKPYKFLENGRADNLWSFAKVCLNLKEIEKKKKNDRYN